MQVTRAESVLGHVCLHLRGAQKPDRVWCKAAGVSGSPDATLDVDIQPDEQNIRIALTPAEARRVARELLAGASLVEGLR